MRNESGIRWPLDLRLFAGIFLIWSALLFLRAISGAHPGSSEPFQDVVLGVKLYGHPARIGMALQALIFGSFSIGILLQKRWGLFLALIYWAYVGASQLLFMIFYFSEGSQREHVHNAAVLLPIMLAILFYVWYRSRPLLRRA